ncbi:hypothetical protein SKAU_G00265360 [Synaphobranchus kaupii]|uniref:Rho GTPase-activating protein 20 n=1 Tax=Synaphobranchus kaupii TaxID=118154 RepID=A0A9Q1EZ71_SYNKA|nr:hypothetical protein SKAU_G00265360 [Synaphobranchus kaupii]
MTPQQNRNHLSEEDNIDVKSRIEERDKRMKTTVHRQRSAPMAIAKTLSKSRTQNRDGVLDLSRNSSLIQTFASQSSSFIMDECVHLTTGLQTQERHLLLFSDTLVIAKIKSSSSLKLKQRVKLREMWLASCVEEVSDRKLNSKNSFVIGWPTTNCVVTLSSSEVMEKWLSALQWYIGKSKEDEYPYKIALKIMVLGVGNSISMTAVQVCNNDTAEKVMQTTVQQLGILGSPTDYHLWVISGKHEVPYPLIGHEHPFSIIMNSLWDAVDQSYLTNNNILSPDGILYLDQLPKGHRVQFILRPAAHSHIRADSFQKHFKRKKSLIDWALRRGNGSQQSNQSDIPTTPQRLFGHSLSSICHNGNLPKPIMDMLFLLYQEGPATRGIFRRSANAKTCKELKERLNSGDAVHLEEGSVFVAASVVTDFLRNLPGSILTTELYSNWMEVIGIDNTDEKIKEIKRLLDELPDANVTLLRHLFGLLYTIQEKSEENQMNAFNLALCIAPNMLWLPVPAAPEEESKSIQKVASLIQFLIENSPSIFGNDIESLFTHLNSGQGAVEDAIDDSFHQLYSSDEFDSEQDRLRGLNYPEKESWSLVLKEEKVLVDEMDPLKKQHLIEDGTYSCGNLDDISFFSSSSVCSLTGIQGIESSRDRCSSEPSVCLSSQPLPQLHIPVTRQSSCDAAVMRGQADGSQPGHRLCVKTTRGQKGDASPRMSGRSKYTFWRSPQITSRFKHSTHGSSLSNRSSFSSLSSTATSPSASSLSSLDSAFSYCSDSVFSSANSTSMPFLLGPSAKMRPLTPGDAGGFAMDWSRTLPTFTVQEPLDLAWSDEYNEKDEENNAFGAEALDDNSSPCAESGHGQPSYPENYWAELHEAENAPGRANARMEVNGSYSEATDVQMHLPNKLSGTSEQIIQSRETSIRQMQLTRPCTSNSLESKKETMKRTKITFYMASSTLEEKKKAYQTTEGHMKLSNADVGSSDSSEPICPTVQVQIPQTVFYGQDIPLVLQSIVTRKPPCSKEQCKQGKMDFEGDATPKHLTEYSSSLPASSKTHSKAANSIRHTITIRLPTAVRNTVKEYFSHSESYSSCISEAIVNSVIYCTSPVRTRQRSKAR